MIGVLQVSSELHRGYFVNLTCRPLYLGTPEVRSIDQIAEAENL
jgi:hypothetical protein